MNVTSSNGSDNVQTAQGIINHMATAVIDSNSHYYVTLKDDNNIYDFALPGMIDIVRYKEGDTIKFTYYKERIFTCCLKSIG